MNALPVAASDALVAFQQAAGWEQRARLLMQWGDRLEALAADERNEENLVAGCESQVWLLGEYNDGNWHFRASSEARVLRGLLAVLLVRVNDLEAGDLQKLNLDDWFRQLGLSRQLSPSRSNGMNAVLQRMREITGRR